MKHGSISLRREQTRRISRRGLLLMGGYGSLLTVLVGRLYWLQIKEGEKYTKLGEKNRLGLRLLEPERGLLLDSRGVVIAANQPIVRISVVPSDTVDMAGLLRELSVLLPIGEQKIRQILLRSRKQPSFVPIQIEDRASWTDVAQIAVRLYKMPGMQIEGSFKRFYPYGEVFSHVLGYVGYGTSSEEELFSQLSETKFGKAGLERALDKRVRGQIGFRQVEINATGRVVREIGRDESKTGENIKLTLDLELQRFLHFQMSDIRAGAAILVEPWSGKVRAMVSKPDFDPNIFSQGLSVEEWNRFRDSKPSPLLNRALLQSYAPGSLFKIVTMLAALESGIDVSRRYNCEGFIDVGKDKLHCWRKSGHGNINMFQALRGSCDVWFYQVMKEVGLEKLMETARRLGFGEKVGDHSFIFESKGFLPSKTWKKEKYGIPWVLGDSLISAIGQGYVSSTVAQIAMMISRIISGGETRALTILEDEGSIVSGMDEGYFSGQVGSSQFTPIIAPNHRQILLKAMNEVVNRQGGTAFSQRLRSPGYSYGGKTGTSQVRRISAEEREKGVIKNQDLPWHLRDHSLFAGYAPIGVPRYVLAVLVEHGGGSTTSALPIAKQVLLRTQIGFDQGIDT